MQNIDKEQQAADCLNLVVHSVIMVTIPGMKIQ